MRSKKVIRLNYWTSATNDPTITLLSNPNEVRISSDNKTFLSLKDNQITIGAGTPATINIQGLSNSMKYAGMLQDLPFPLCLIPSTAVTPLPKQIIVPPLLDLLPTLKQAAKIAASLLG